MLPAMHTIHEARTPTHTHTHSIAADPVLHMQWLEAREEQERFLREAEEAKQKADADLLQAAVRRFSVALSEIRGRPWRSNRKPQKKQRRQS